MARKKIHINWRIVGYMLYLIAGTTGVVFLMGAVSVKSSEQACREMRIMIIGEEAFVEQKDIAALIEADYGQLVGRTLGSIPIHQIEQQLEKIPYVLSAQVHADMNGVLHVLIAQRSAVLRIIDDEGKGFYVDDHGLKMPVSPSYIPHVPVASGRIPEQYTDPLDTVESVLVQELFEIARMISRDSLWSRHIVQLYVNDDAEIELIPRNGNHRILFGNGKDLVAKFERLRIYYAGIVPKTGPDAYSIVNVKYEDQLVCERNPAYRPPGDSLRQDERPPLPDSLQQWSNNSQNIQQ